MTVSVFSLPSTDHMLATGLEWVRERQLDPEITYIAGEDHDWAHAVFCLGEQEKGIVFAIQECFEADLVPDIDLFFDLCMRHRVSATDAFEVEAVLRVFRQLEQMRRKDG